jgi:hypothetical protein
MVVIMVKIYCDRCKNELDKVYYTIHFSEYDTNPHYESIDTTAYASTYSSTYSSETRTGALKTLNSQRMYCHKCKSEIDDFISSI